MVEGEGGKRASPLMVIHTNEMSESGVRPNTALRVKFDGIIAFLRIKSVTAFSRSNAFFTPVLESIIPLLLFLHVLKKPAIKSISDIH
jgi:hypothetical protein